MAWKFANGTDWDASGKKFYETGVDRGVLYPWDSDQNKYGDGVLWNGLTSINDSPSGADPTDLWADNIKYLSIRAAEEYGFTINAYQSPDEFDECDGMRSIGTGVTITQQNRKMFGFSYRTLVGNDTEYNDLGYKIHLIYGATCSPSDKDRSTVNDSPDAVEFSWECTTTPTPITGYKPTAHIVIDSRKFKGDASSEALLENFEKILYGYGSTTAKLPTPDEVLAYFGTTVTYTLVTFTNTGTEQEPVWDPSYDPGQYYTKANGVYTLLTDRLAPENWGAANTFYTQDTDEEVSG